MRDEAEANCNIVPPERFWAKVNPAEGLWHPLIAHSADVAAVVSRLLAPDSHLAARLAGTIGQDRLPDSLQGQLVFLAALHDAGKVNHGFQNKAGRGTSGMWPAQGHVRPLLDSLRVPEVQQFMRSAVLALGEPRDVAQDLLQSAICHHGRPWKRRPRSTGLRELWQPDGDRDPSVELERLLAQARAWSACEPSPGSTLPSAKEFAHVFAGLLTIADWVGSTTAAFPMQPAADDSPDLYWNVACERADQACRKIGLLAEPLSFQATGSPLLARLFPAIFPHFPPSPLQRAASTMPLPAPGSRILIESETGSGKTEASLTLYARLRAEGLVGGLFFALPTRATAAAISDRVAHFLGCAYADVGAPTSALAVGGQAQRTEGFGFPGVDPDLYPDADDRELRAWASSSSKKYLTAEIVVGTLDQLLLGGLPVRHAHLRLAAATRHLLVVDELHSYDRYMGEILSRVLDLHSCAGGVSVLMSATLSEKERLRYALVDEPPRSSTARTASEAEYPMLAEAVPHGADPWRAHELASEPSRFGKELRWSMIDESDLVGIAASAAVDGARVCVLRNTVTGARTSLDALAADSVAGDHLWHPYPARGPDRPAYHSRYTRADRAALDAAVLRDFGRTGAASGTILVATQVVEQSLDVDFDLMISDLPPVDALLQRVGRLHRHPERVRPLGHVDAQTYVIGPADATFTEWLNQKKERGENGWGTVYEDLVDLELTVGVIRDHPEIKIPEQNRLLIELVYHPEHRDRLADSSSRWEEYARRANSRALGQEINARQVALEFTTETYTTSVGRFEEAQEQRIRTRLGDDQVRIELPRPVPGHYGDGLAYFVELPIRIVSRVDDDSPTTLVCTAIEAKPAHYLLGETVIWYDAQGWHW